MDFGCAAMRCGVVCHSSISFLVADPVTPPRPRLKSPFLGGPGESCRCMGWYGALVGVS